MGTTITRAPRSPSTTSPTRRRHSKTIKKPSESRHSRLCSTCQAMVTTKQGLPNSAKEVNLAPGAAVKAWSSSWFAVHMTGPNTPSSPTEAGWPTNATVGACPPTRPSSLASKPWRTLRRLLCASRTALVEAPRTGLPRCSRKLVGHLSTCRWVR